MDGYCDNLSSSPVRSINCFKTKWFTIHLKNSPLKSLLCLYYLCKMTLKVTYDLSMIVLNMSSKCPVRWSSIFQTDLELNKEVLQAHLHISACLWQTSLSFPICQGWDWIPLNYCNWIDQFSLLMHIFVHHFILWPCCMCAVTGKSHCCSTSTLWSVPALWCCWSSSVLPHRYQVHSLYVFFSRDAKLQITV